MDNRDQNQNEYQPRFLKQDAAKAGKQGGKKALSIVLSLLGVAILVGGAIFAVKSLRKPQEEPTEAPTEVVTEAPTEAATEAPTEAPTEPETEAPTEPPYEPDEELTAAMEQNPDIYARLTYGDGDPQFILYADNEFYMTHDAFKNNDYEGAPFIDARCSVMPRDTNLMIHGHNMDATNSGNGKAFANLFLFQDKEYMAEHPIFKLETATSEEYYVPYALATVETYDAMPGYFRIIEWNFDSDQAFKDYTGHFMENSLLKMPVTAEPGDDLLTLSACINDGNDQTELRLLVCLRMLREDETVEQMQELYKNAFTE